MNRISALILATALGLPGACEKADTAHPQAPAPATTPTEESQPTMDLGAFSISLAVKDLTASRAFYEKLGFRAIGGEAEQNWLVLQNGTTTIGLFQGMFESNILTFNPGWTADEHGSAGVAGFRDIREIQAELLGAGLELTTRADPQEAGPASLTLADPDGNVILIDQHVPAPPADG